MRNDHMKGKPTLPKSHLTKMSNKTLHEDNSCEQTPPEDIGFSWGLHWSKCSITDSSTILTEINATLLKILNCWYYNYNVISLSIGVILCVLSVLKSFHSFRNLWFVVCTPSPGGPLRTQTRYLWEMGEGARVSSSCNVTSLCKHGNKF